MFITQTHINTNKNGLLVSSNMKFIQGQNREQIYLFPVSLGEAVDPENEVRLIDVFVDSLKIDEFGFKVDYVENGRPAYCKLPLFRTI